MCAAPGLHVSLDRVQNGYVSSGTVGYTRPTADALKGANSSKNVPASARAWTRVPHSSFPRNEGVPGSSPGVGFRLLCRAFFCTDNAGTRSAGTKQVHNLTRSRLVKVSR